VIVSNQVKRKHLRTKIQYKIWHKAAYLVTGLKLEEYRGQNQSKSQDNRYRKWNKMKEKRKNRNNGSKCNKEHGVNNHKGIRQRTKALNKSKRAYFVRRTKASWLTYPKAYDYH
jgi:hypothetical protein